MNSIELTDKSCKAFVAELSSRAMVPGGGGAAALAGSLGAALCSMAGNLTIGKKKYQDVEAEVTCLVEQSSAMSKRLLELVNEDAAAFAPLQKAYSLPKDQPDRDKIMETVSLAACEAPLSMLKTIAEAIGLLSRMLEIGSAAMISDVGCGAILCRAAMESAGLNIFINTKSLDCKEARDLEHQADALLSTGTAEADRIARAVTDRLRGRA